MEGKLRFGGTNVLRMGGGGEVSVVQTACATGFVSSTTTEVRA